MAKIIGDAARYTTAQSVKLFQKMLLTSMIVIFGVGMFEGANLATLFWRWGNAPLWTVLPMTAGLVATWWICRYQSRKIEEYEQQRMNFRKGTRGEQTVVEVLEVLSDEFYVINDLKIAGNLDHVVVGPTGVFAIETKNWRGAVCADGKGELLCNGKPTTKPEVKGLVRRLMKTREKLTALTECDVFIKGVMVFPRARVDARFGTTSHVHCVTDEQLCGYIEDKQFAKPLTKAQVGQLVRAFTGIANMEPAFTQAASVPRRMSGDSTAAGSSTGVLTSSGV